MNKLYADEVMKFLRYHDSSTIGKKKDKIMRIMAHHQEINYISLCTTEQVENNESEYNDSEEERDADDEVVTAVERDRECSKSDDIDVTVSGGALAQGGNLVQVLSTCLQTGLHI